MLKLPMYLVNAMSYRLFQKQKLYQVLDFCGTKRRNSYFTKPIFWLLLWCQLLTSFWQRSI